MVDIDPFLAGGLEKFDPEDDVFLDSRWNCLGTVGLGFCEEMTHLVEKISGVGYDIGCVVKTADGAFEGFGGNFVRG